MAGDLASPMGSSRAVVLLALVLGALALAACGGDDERFDVAADVQPLGEMRAGSISQLARCEDWNGGTIEQKQATVVDLREQLSGGGVEAGTPSITDQEAYDTFERACANDFTSAFQLYKIYFRAAAFNNFDPEQYSEGG